MYNCNIICLFFLTQNCTGQVGWDGTEKGRDEADDEGRGDDSLPSLLAVGQHTDPTTRSVNRPHNEIRAYKNRHILPDGRIGGHIRLISQICGRLGGHPCPPPAGWILYQSSSCGIWIYHIEVIKFSFPDSFRRCLVPLRTWIWNDI